MKEPPRLGQGRLRTAEDLGESDRAGQENRRVAPVNDPDVRRPSLLFNPAKLPGREPFGMQRAIEHLKRQIGDLRSSETNTHAQIVLSGSVSRRLLVAIVRVPNGSHSSIVSIRLSVVSCYLIERSSGRLDPLAVAKYTPVALESECPA